MRRAACILTLAAALLVVTSHRIDAHKPITSPFTFSADVQPILQARCGRCHKPGGVAPMSLLTHADTLPWGESLRLELMSGHMPPWRVERGAARFHDPGGLSARELNVLLTWVTGGTPPGDPSSNAAPPTEESALGRPDVLLPLPRVTLAADEQERTIEFVLPMAAGSRALRAVDLLPGNPAVVRNASIEVAGTNGPGLLHDERVLSLWVPGDATVPLAAGNFAVPPEAKLLVRIHYRKTWEYQRRDITDDSRVGLYFAPATWPRVQRVGVSAGATVRLPHSARALAIYPDNAVTNAQVAVTAIHPDGTRDELIVFHPRPGWVRRYWFREPVSLPPGTRLSVRVNPDSPTLLPPGYPPPRRELSSNRVFVNLIP